MDDLPIPNGMAREHPCCCISKWIDDMKNFRLIRNIASFILILALNVGVYIGYQQGYSWEDIGSLLSGSPMIAVLTIIGFYCLKTVVWIIPIYALYIGAGFLLPVWSAIAVTYVGLILDLTLTFYLGRHMGRSRIMDEIKHRKAGKWMLDTAERNSSFACFIIRLLPGPPTEITNMFFGTLNMQFGKFLILSIVGMTPGILPVIFMGKSAMDPLSKEFILPLFISLVIAAGSILLYWFVLKKRDKPDID